MAHPLVEKPQEPFEIAQKYYKYPKKPPKLTVFARLMAISCGIVLGTGLLAMIIMSYLGVN